MSSARIFARNFTISTCKMATDVRRVRCPALYAASIAVMALAKQPAQPSTLGVRAIRCRSFIVRERGCVNAYLADRKRVADAAKNRFVVPYFPLTTPNRAAEVVAAWRPLSNHVTAVIYYAKQFHAPCACASSLALRLGVSNGHLLSQ